MSMEQGTRRGFLIGALALVTAPAIIRAESLMPVKLVDLYDTRALLFYDIKWDGLALRVDRSLQRMERPKQPGIWEIPIHVAKKVMRPQAFSLRPPEGVQQSMDMRLTLSDFVAINFDIPVERAA